MSDVPDDELISAYLDGELSGEELLRAENLLATQPESRQLLEELTSLRASLQGLKRQPLEPGFADGVLRRAEREMLQPATAPAPRATVGHPAARISWQRWRRPLAWSAAAIAAGLLLMVLSPGEQQKVAVAPAQAPAGGELNATPAAPALAHRANEDLPQVAAHPRSAPAPAAAPMAAEEPTFGIARDSVDEKEALDSAALFNEANDQLVVVHCDVTTRAEAEVALRGLLATNQIAWEAAPSEKEQTFERAKQSVPTQGQTTDNSRKPEQSDLHAELAEAVYVLADRAQLQTTIDALQSNRAFRNVRFQRVDAPAGDRAIENLSSQLFAGKDESLTHEAPLIEAEGRARAQMTRLPQQQQLQLQRRQQQGAAVQLSPAEAQNLQVDSDSAARGAAAYSIRAAGKQDAQGGGQDAAQNSPAPEQSKLSIQQASQSRQLRRQAARQQAPATRDADGQGAPESTQLQSSPMARALIILQVAPDEPGGAKDSSPVTP